MRIALVFPPLADATQPYSSLPALAAVARRAGHEVDPVDANLGFVLSLLSAQGVEAAAREVRRRLDAAPGEGGAPPSGAVQARRIAACLKAPAVAAGIAGAVADLRRAATFRDLGRLAAARRLVDEALEIHAAAWPAGLAAGAAAVPELGWPASVAEWAEDRRRNPFRDYLEAETLPRLAARNPGAVGVSITYRSQVLPAFTLASLVRRHLPGVPVIFGGSMATRWHDAVDACPELFDACHHLVAFEGESALVALLAALEGRGDLAAVPNLAFRRRRRVVRTPVAWEDVDSLPTPDYAGLPLADYLTPQPVFLLATARGCYWRRCTFCSVSPAMAPPGGPACRVRHPDRVHRDVATLVERHGAHCISLADDCVSPSALRALATRLGRHGPAISWQCEVRFEKALDRGLLEALAAAGCRNLIFGLESAVPRVLERMDKGVAPAEIRRVLDDCRRAGIAFNLQFFFGFPGETAAEAAATADFAAAEMHGAATFSFGVFELQKGAPVERDPGAFGIRRVERTGGPLEVRYDYAPAPAHAAAARDGLRRRLGEGSRHRHAGLSINAHTLLFLHEAGVEALGDLYRGAGPAGGKAGGRSSAVATGLMDRPLRPASDLGALEVARVPSGLLDGGDEGAEGGAVLLYDHSRDRTVEVPRLALWLLRHLDGTATPAALAAALATATGAGAADTRTVVERLVADLHGRGFLHPAAVPGAGGAERRPNFHRRAT